MSSTTISKLIDFAYPRLLSRGLFLWCLWNMSIVCAMNPNYCDLDIYDEKGMPLLCHAVQYDNDGLYLQLLQRGAFVNIQDLQGRNPLFYAAKAGDRSKIETLLLYGAAANRNIYESLNAWHPMGLYMLNKFCEQKCYVCNTHDFDLSNIPCINRHLGNFICVCCYTTMCYDNKTKCPICLRTLGKFGF